jgi:cytochrome oxidase Cu insertion factor (SCO1/SenC/PrrC family)
MGALIVCGVLALAGAAHGQSLWTQQTGTDSPPVQSAGVRPELLRDVALDQKLNDSIPLDLTFHDEKGRTVALRSFFGQKPVILTLVYYQCPMLCNQVLNSLAHSLKDVPLELGKDFEVVTVSIDPAEKPVIAEAKRQLYVGMYARPGVEQGWHFLTGDCAANQGARGSCGLPLRLRFDDRPVRAPERNHGADARWQAGALFLRHQVSAERFAIRAGGSFGGEDWIAGGSDSALLLSLRSGDGEIRDFDFARASNRGIDHIAGAGADGCDSSPARAWPSERGRFRKARGIGENAIIS